MDSAGLPKHGAGRTRNGAWAEARWKYDPDTPYPGVNSKIGEIIAHPRFQQLLRDMKLYHWAVEFAGRFGGNR